jgi:O-antigen/teichoic acid export membrane protein
VAKTLKSETPHIAPKAADDRAFVQNTAVLAGGSFASQGVILLTLPIITRIYAPEAFGLFATFAAATAILISISHFRYNLPIQLPKEQKDADALALAAFLLVGFTALVLSFVAWFFGGAISAALGFEKAGYVIYLIPLAVFLDAVYRVLSAWHLRKKAFKRIAVSRVTGTAGSRATSISLGAAGIIGPEGLIAGQIAGSLFNIAAISAGKNLRAEASIISRGTAGRLRKVAVRYQRFPRFFLTPLLQVCTQHLPVLLLGLFFKPAVVGYYALARRTMLQPSTLVSDSISRSLYQRLAEMCRDGQDIAPFILRILSTMTKLTVLPTLLLCFSAPDVFLLLFGDKWADAAIYAQLSLPMISIAFISRPFGVLFNIFERQKEQFIFNVVQFLLSAIALTTAAFFANAYYTVGIFSTLLSVFMLVRLRWLMSLANVTFRQLGPVLQRIVRQGFFLLPLLAVNFFFSQSSVYVAAVAGLTLIIYLAHLAVSDDLLKSWFGGKRIRSG